MASVYAKINIEIIKASSLLGMNIGGTSNPFVKVEIGAKNYTTPTIENTTEPNWREKGLQTQCTFQFPAVHTPTVVTISVYNKLPYGDQLSDFIGQASVTVMKPGQNQQMIPLTHGGNMQLANKAPTGCGMIEVAYDAQEVSESEYFDALLGKTSSSSTVNTPVVPMATIPEPSNPAAPAPVAAPAEQPQEASAPAAVMAPPSNTTNTNTANSSVNSTPMDSTMAPPPATTTQQQEEEPAPVPPPVQTASATEPTPDVSMVQQQQNQQQTLSQQHQIPSLGSFNANTNNNQNNNNNLPPRAPQPLTLAHSNSGAMPSSFDNNQQQQQQHVQVQAPSQNNVAPMPEPQAHYAYVPQMNIASSQNQNQVASSTNNSARNTNNNHNQQQRRASSAGRQNQNNSTMSSARTNVNNNHHHHHNSSSVGLMNRSSANTMMNTSAAAVGNSSSIHHHNNNKPKSEKLSVTATRWFDMIRTGGTSAGHALREIRAASEKDPSIVLEACDSSGRTLIHEAAWSGTVELFQELLALAIRAGNSRPTAMSMQLWASEQHNIAAWTTIPSDGYQGPKYVTMNAGNTVLHTAAAAGRVDLVDWMLRQGAVFVAMAQTRNKRGLRPLESAAERGHMETAQVLARSTTA